MSTINVKAIKQWVYVFERESPDPASGRSEERQLLRLSVGGAREFIVWIQEALPEAEKFDRASRQMTLRAAQRDLVVAQDNVNAIKRKIKELDRV